MVTLTETLIDLADQHTTLYYFGAPPPAAPLPLGAAATYNGLHETLAATPRRPYGELRKGAESSVLEKFSPAYGDYKYWHRFLGSSNPDGYPGRAWEDVLPVEATLKCRVSCEAAGHVAAAAAPAGAEGAQPGFSVRPFPRVLLYPFGWSVWVSLRVTGAHTFAELAALTRAVFTEKVFRPEGAAEAITLRDFLRHVSEGVRADAFGGEKQTRDAEPSALTLVTTVLAKHGGSLSPSALGPAEEEQLRRLVRPEGHLPGKTVDEMLYLYDPADPFEYMLSDEHSRFVWIEHLLDPVGRNYQHLRCYHHNTFRSLVHARHLCSLINAASESKARSQALVEAAQGAADTLEKERYQNAGLRVFLSDPDTLKTIEDAGGLQASGKKK